MTIHGWTNCVHLNYWLNQCLLVIIGGVAEDSTSILYAASFCTKLHIRKGLELEYLRWIKVLYMVGAKHAIVWQQSTHKLVVFNRLLTLLYSIQQLLITLAHCYSYLPATLKSIDFVVNCYRLKFDYNNSKNGGSVYYKEITACVLGGGDVVGDGGGAGVCPRGPSVVVDVGVGREVVDVGAGRETVDVGAGGGTVDVGAGGGIVHVGVGGSQYRLHGQSLTML